MQLRIFQKGFNYSQDGPGNRLIYHLQGCNLHCPWCSNPESMATDGGQTLDTSEIVSQALSARMMFFDGGGVTFTGGEPTVQFDALREALMLLRQNSINTAIETNGTNPKLPLLFEYTDYLIMDFKHWDSAKLRQFTGCSNETVCHNLDAACRNKLNPLIRIPLIHSFNSSPDDAREFLKLFSPYADGMRVEVLRYHEYGKDKWEQNSMEYKMRDAFVGDDEFDEFCSILKNGSINLIKT